MAISASEGEVVSCRVDLREAMLAAAVCSLVVNILFVLSLTVLLFVLKLPLRLQLAGQGIKGEGMPRRGVIGHLVNYTPLAITPYAGNRAGQGKSA